MKPLSIAISIFIGVLVMQLCGSVAPGASAAGLSQQSKNRRPPTVENGRFTPDANLFNGSFSDYFAATWNFLFSGNDRTPKTELPLESVDLSHFSQSDSGQLNVTWLGHSSLMVNIDGYKILIDPVFEKRVSVFGPTRFNGEVPLDIRQLPQIDAVIISHDHYDHLNKHSIRHLIPRAVKFIVPLAVGARLAKWGVPRDKIVELGWWESYRYRRELTLIATPAQHFSGRGLTDRNKTLWVSWVIRTPFHKLFFSGDSGYFEGFKQIGDTYGPFDMTFIECGAYNNAWAQVHMFPEQTVQAHLDLKGNVLHPIHWATFNLSLHPWYEPMERISATAEAHNVSIATPVVGETTVFGKPIADTKWWRPAMARHRTSSDGS